jgi:DNA-binding PadR family transcriptional regulator
VVTDGSYSVQKEKEEFVKRLISAVLDIVIIMHFEQETFSGYDVILFVHKQLGVMLSPGTIYATLYAMERNQFLISANGETKRVFRATEKGLRLAKLLSSPEEIIVFMSKIVKKRFP